MVKEIRLVVKKRKFWVLEREQEWEGVFDGYHILFKANKNILI